MLIKMNGDIGLRLLPTWIHCTTPHQLISSHHSKHIAVAHLPPCFSCCWPWSPAIDRPWRRTTRATVNSLTCLRIRLRWVRSSAIWVLDIPRHVVCVCGATCRPAARPRYYEFERSAGATYNNSSATHRHRLPAKTAKQITGRVGYLCSHEDERSAIIGSSSLHGHQRETAGRLIGLTQSNRTAYGFAPARPVIPHL